MIFDWVRKLHDGVEGNATHEKPALNYLAQGEKTCAVQYKAIGVPTSRKNHAWTGRYKVPERCTIYWLHLFWPVAPRYQLDKHGSINTKEPTCVVHYHADIVPIQKRLRKVRRLATFRRHFTRVSKTTLGYRRKKRGIYA